MRWKITKKILKKIYSKLFWIPSEGDLVYFSSSKSTGLIISRNQTKLFLLIEGKVDCFIITFAGVGFYTGYWTDNKQYKIDYMHNYNYAQ